jgi:hypothetical protein
MAESPLLPALILGAVILAVTFLLLLRRIIFIGVGKVFGVSFTETDKTIGESNSKIVPNGIFFISIPNVVVGIVSRNTSDNADQLDFVKAKAFFRAVIPLKSSGWPVNLMLRSSRYAARRGMTRQWMSYDGRFISSDELEHP